MSKHSSRITEMELHAYVDGLLDADRIELIEQYLAENPDKAEELQTWKNQNQAINSLFEPAAREPIPDRLKPETVWLSQKESAIRWKSIAAAITLFAIGSTTGWFGRELASPNTAQALTFAEQAINAHSVFAVEVRHPVEVSADEQTHLVGWLSNRLGKPISAPNLESQGFNLIGGRLLPAREGPAAQFMYEDASGRRITLYAVSNKSEQLAAFRFFKEADYSAFYWLDTDISYAIVGNVSRDDLKELATDIYQQLT